MKKKVVTDINPNPELDLRQNSLSKLDVTTILKDYSENAMSMSTSNLFVK